MRIVAASDKFKGTASAPEVVAAIARAATAAGATCDEAPMSDGGEGFIDALGGPNRTMTVSGPLGDPVEAPWRFAHDRAVIEMAAAAGLTLAGGAEHNDPIAASTHGVGELIAMAVESGARRVLVGVGGSATTDGGLGCVACPVPARSLSRRRSLGRAPTCEPSSSTPPRCSLRRRARPPRRSSSYAAGSSAWPAPISTTMASTCGTSKAPARPVGSAAGWRRSAPSCSPASTSSPTK